MNRRLSIDVFFDMMMALETPVGVTHFAFKSRLDNRQARKNLARLQELGLIKKDGHTRKIQLTDNGIVIFNIINRGIIKGGTFHV